MPVTLAKTISKLQSNADSTNAQLIKEMYEYLKSNGVSERHQNNALKVRSLLQTTLVHILPSLISIQRRSSNQTLFVYVFYFYGFCQNYSYSEGAPCPFLNY